MADISLPAAAGISAAVGLVTGVGGALAAIYARGRADGKRDQRLDDHDRRLSTHGEAIGQIRAEGHDTAKAVSGLASEVKAVGRTVDAIYAMLNGGGGRK